MASPFLRTAATPALHKAVDTRRLCVTAALTYPVHDRAGDYVQPDGGDWSVHKADPWVGLEHYRFSKSRNEMLLPGEPGATEEIVRVGTAADPDTGAHSVVLKAMPEGRLPFGTTWFDPADRLSAQTFRLVEEGALEGVSLEFTLRKGMYRELGPSPLERRNAYHVDGWNGLGWVHCVTPVNPGAQILKAVGAAQDIVLRVVTSGRVGDEPAHPLILKSLARFAPGKSATVTGGFTPVEMKAMDEQPADMTAAYEPDGDEAGGGGGNGITGVYDHAQQIEDLAASIAAIADTTDSGELAKDVAKLAAVITAAAEKVKAVADKHQAKLDAAKGGGEEAEPAEDAPADMDKDDDGVLKAMAPRHYKAVKAARVRRFSKAEVAAAPVVAAPADPEAETLAYLTDLEKTDPKAFRALAREAKQLQALTR